MKNTIQDVANALGYNGEQFDAYGATPTIDDEDGFYFSFNESFDDLPKAKQKRIIAIYDKTTKALAKAAVRVKGDKGEAVVYVSFDYSGGDYWIRRMQEGMRFCPCLSFNSENDDQPMLHIDDKKMAALKKKAAAFHVKTHVALEKMVNEINKVAGEHEFFAWIE